MKKFFRRLAILFVVLIVLIVAASLIITSLFGNKIGNTLVNSINEQINSELIVEDFDFSLIRSFPNISANLRNVLIKDTKEDVLVEAEKLAFNLGLLGLIRSKIDIKSVALSAGNANISIDRNGNANYAIFKEVPETATGETDVEQKSYAINFDKVILEDLTINYDDQSIDQQAALWVENSEFSGAFDANQFSLKTNASLLTKALIIDDQRYLVGKDAALEGDIQVDLDQNKYLLNDLVFTLGKNSFDLTGFVEQQNKETYFDIILKNDEGNLASLLQLLPKNYIEGIETVKSSGNFDFSATIQGLLGKEVQPAINAKLELSRGKISAPALKKDFKDVTISAQFNNGRRQNAATTVFQIDRLEGYFGKKRLEANFKYENLKNPKIDLYLDGVLPMDAIYSLIGSEDITAGEGEMELKGINLHGLLKDIQNPNRFARVETSGGIQFLNAGLTVRDEQLNLVSGSLSLRDKLLSVKELIFDGAGSELQFEGSAFNLIPVLFADSVNSKRAELEFDATLKAKSIDFDRLMALTAVDSSDASLTRTEIDSMKTAHVQKREKLTNFLKGSFNAVIESYNFNKIEGEDFTGKVEFINNEMLINGTTLAMDGKVKVDGRVLFEGAPEMKTKFEFENINIKQLFEQTDNFGQSVLKSENIDGALNSKTVVYAYWDESGRLLEDKLRVLSGVGMENGELVNFEMLKQFSQFVKVEDLMNIKFSNLQNFLEYRRKRLILPVMFIQSNAMNLTVSGEHTYDNEMRYNIKVNAGQVLANKFKKFNPDLEPLKARQKGFINLYFMIYGNVDNYEIKNSKKRVKEDFELSSIRKRELWLALEKEFGHVALVEEPVEWRDIPEYDNNPETGEEEEFLDFEEGSKRDTIGRN